MDNQHLQKLQTKKERALKSFAVAGFVAIIILISWLGIKFVSVLPNTISSLASIADTVYNYKKPEIIVVANKMDLKNGETVNLSWSVPSQKGTFAISYICTPGISVEIKSDTDFPLLNCATNYNLGAASGIDLNIFSERNRYTEVNFNIDFIPTNASEPTASATRKVTILNSLIASDYNPEIDTNQPIIEPIVTKPTTTTATTTTTPANEYIQVPIYGTPISNPNGNTDLTAHFITWGTFSATNIFSRSTVINKTTTGGIQFEVKNIGTKTSGLWTYILTLPNGTVYTSPKQTALKPNERTTITIGFPMTGISTGAKTATVAVLLIGDSNLLNNSFTARVDIR